MIRWVNDKYHHGDLRRALLDAAPALIAEVGPSGASLRELARRTGVSHAAPTHHFGDRQGLLTALATEGLHMLTTALREATQTSFDEAAIAYVRFARTHPAHYAVMHRPELLDLADPDLAAASHQARRALADGVATLPPKRLTHVNADEAATAAWALVHGMASLADEGLVDDHRLEELTRKAAHQLFG